MHPVLAAAFHPDLTPSWTDTIPHFPLPDQQPDLLVQMLAEQRRTNELLGQVVALLQGPQQTAPQQQTPSPLTGAGMASMLQDLEARRASRHPASEEARTVRTRY